MASGIYEIVCSRNGRRYCGSAVNVAKRWREHLRQLDRGNHHSRHMQRCWNRHGASAFQFRILILCDRSTLLFYEQRAIDAYKPEFNTSPTAGSQLGLKMSDEARAKLSAAAKRTRNFTGKSHSLESRAKISASRKGKGGGPRSPERIERIRAAMIGRVITPEWRAKISSTLMGHKQSEVQIEKRMSKIRGRKMPPGFSERARQRMLGKKLSPETVLKIAKQKAKLTDNQVREIKARLSLGETQKSIADAVGVHPSVVSTIRSNTSYRWVT